MTAHTERRTTTGRLVVTCVIIAVIIGCALAYGWVNDSSLAIVYRKVTTTDTLVFCNQDDTNICDKTANELGLYVNRTGLNSVERAKAFPTAPGTEVTLTVATVPGEGTPSVIEIGD